MRAFKQYNQLFLNQPCSEYGILLLERHITKTLKNNDPLYQYRITRVFNILIDRPRVVLCSAYVKKPILLINLGQIPDYILNFSKPSRKFLSLFKLYINLRRT